MKNKEIQQLKQELKQILENIERVEKYVEEDKKKKYKSYTSHVFGELKHRCTALKVTITRVGKLSTYDLTKD
jgi:ElaB/YqjD/DUF883 family membrane-anchored ribosome-binding protein